MRATIETKGFRPGAVLDSFLSLQIKSVMELDKELVWTEFRLTFENHCFQGELRLVFADGDVSISLCNKNFYDAVLNIIDFATGLLKVKRNVVAIKRRVVPMPYAVSKHTSFQFSAN